MQYAPHNYIYPFQIIPLLFLLLFIAVLILILVTIVKSLTQWNKNNHSPVLTVNAKVVSKRTSIRHNTHSAGNTAGSVFTTSSTSYYATFEVESSDRMEFHISPEEYGMMAEGDIGNLTFQGTRYLSFNRTN